MKDTHAHAGAQRALLSALLAPALTLAACLGLESLLQPGFSAWPAAAPLLRRLVVTASWLAGLWLLLRALDALLWARLLPRWLGLRAPALLRQFVGLLVALMGLGLLLTREWELALPAVLATTGVLGVVLGLALRNVLADFFAGIALNIEKPFDIGDFVLLRVRSQREPFTGTVREINWRSTRLLTPEDNLVSVPNSVVASSIVENLSYPSPVSELELDLTLDWDVDQALAEQVLQAAATEAWARGATAGERPPKLRICRIDGGGITWRVVYLLDPRQRAKGPARHLLLACMHRHLRLAGLRPAALPGQLPNPVPPVEPDRLRALAELPLLRGLSLPEREQLAAGLRERSLAVGETATRHGEPGDSMFLVLAGALEVKSEADAQRLNVLGAGASFGEMALLTGEPRSATVAALAPSRLYELDRALLAPLLAQRPALAEELAAAVAEHQQRDRAREALADARNDSAVGRMRQLSARIAAWLRPAAAA